jgi:hypothetical protein
MKSTKKEVPMPVLSLLNEINPMPRSKTRLEPKIHLRLPPLKKNQDH